MDARNPSLDPPILAPPFAPSPDKRHDYRLRSPSPSPSRSPSHSPSHPRYSRHFDPLLRDLSPTSTLRAFASPSSSRSASPTRSALKQSFLATSSTQRATGTRAAHACLQIRTWAAELEAWEWPGCFEEPEPPRKAVRASLLSIWSFASAKNVPQDGDADPDEKDSFCGSLPTATVHAYDRRIHEISAALDDLQVDELKAFVLAAHRSQDAATEVHGSSADSAISDPKTLDDFTAVVTATILQTLPHLSRLCHLLDTWSARLAVLSRIPEFLRDLDQLRTDLDHGWAAVAVSLRKHAAHAALAPDDMRHMQSLIETRMASLASRLDSFLDLLEGREDCVPEAYLDKFEELEGRYAEWVVMAQRRVLGDELRKLDLVDNDRDQPDVDVVQGDLRDETRHSGHSQADNTRDSTGLDGHSHATADGHDSAQNQTMWYEDSDAEQPLNDPRSHASPPSHESARAAHVSPPAPDSQADSAPHDSVVEELTVALSKLQNHRRRNSTGDSVAALHVPRSSSSRPVSGDFSYLPRKSRHVPIVLPFDGDGSEYQPSPLASTTHLVLSERLERSDRSEGSDRSDRPDKLSSPDRSGWSRASNNSDKPRSPAAKSDRPMSPLKRESFANPRSSMAAEGDIAARQRSLQSPGPDGDRLASLQRQAKSPVRPFERASNAFTRLFTRDKSPEPERPRSWRSIESAAGSSGRGSGSLRREPKGGEKSGEKAGGKPNEQTSVVWGGRATSPAGGQESEVGEAKTEVTPDATRPSAERKHEQGLRQDAAERPSSALAARDVPPRDGSRRLVAVTMPEDASKPQTYRPRRPSSPLSSPTEHDVPDNWPLVSPPNETSPVAGSPVGTALASGVDEGPLDNDYALNRTGSGRNIANPTPIASDIFQRIFIDGFPFPEKQSPSIPDKNGEESLKHSRDGPESQRPRTPTSNLTQTPPRDVDEPVVLSTMLSSDGRQDDLSVARAMSVEALKDFGNRQTSDEKYMHTPPRHSRVSSLPISVDSPNAESVHTPDEDMEVHDASVAYFPIAVTPRASRDLSLALGNKTHPETVSAAGPAKTLKVVIPSSTVPRPASATLVSHDSEQMGEGDEMAMSSSPEEQRGRKLDAAGELALKRASMASIQAHARSEVKSIDVPPPPLKLNTSNGAASRPSSTVHTPLLQTPVEQQTTDQLPFLTPPVHRHTSSESDGASPVSPLNEKSPGIGHARGASFSEAGRSAIPASAIGLLNQVVPKRRRREVPVADAVQTSHVASLETKRPRKNNRDSVSRAAKASAADGDTFDRHVSQVLEKIPAPIRFKSSSSHDPPASTSTPHPQLTAEPGNYTGPRPKSRFNTRNSPGAAAAPTGAGNTNGGSLILAPADSTPSKRSHAPAEPNVKLYHLTQPGRDEPIRLFVRLVGDGQRVMVRVGGGWADLADFLRQYAEHHGSRTVSDGGGAAVGLEVQTAGSSPANSSAATAAARRVSGPAAAAAGAERRVFVQPGSRDGDAGESVKRGAGNPAHITGSPVSPTAETTPFGTGQGSRPSTADAAPHSGFKAATSEQKAKWIEGMLERATREAVAGRDAKAEAFGDMGKAGTTRRVVFRTSSATAGAGVEPNEDGDVKAQRIPGNDGGDEGEENARKHGEGSGDGDEGRETWVKD